MTHQLNQLPILEPTPAKVIAAPHAHDQSSVSRIMWSVCLALSPMTIYGFYLFGWPAINLCVVTCLAALATESLSLYWLKKPQLAVFDGSAMLTGLLLALSLPPWAPWWLGVGGSAFAVGIGKQLYGGVGQNIFNPAMLARCALLISFPLQMTTWPLPMIGQSLSFVQGLQITFAGIVPDGSTGATALGHLKTSFTLAKDARDVLAHDFSLQHTLVGTVGGSLGETATWLIVLSGVWLIYKRIISWEIPVSMLIGIILPAVFAHWINPARYADMMFHISTGGLLLGAFFIATDPVTSPASGLAKLIFGFGCGVLTWIIRTWGGFPEAVAFAVLFMNALTPLLDRYVRPRIYGRLASGKPLKVRKVSDTVKKRSET
jgi:electron transport complex protein RnfD